MLLDEISDRVDFVELDCADAASFNDKSKAYRCPFIVTMSQHYE